MSTKIYASSISNLTDARYFSAMGVDYMGFDLDVMMDRPSHLKEMISWIEGPIIVGETNTYNADGLKDLKTIGIKHWSVGRYFNLSMTFEDQLIRRLGVSCLGNLNDEEWCALYIDKAFATLSEKELEKIGLLCEKCKTFIHLPFEAQDLESIIRDIKPYGIILLGGEEEKPGYKSYDEMDELFEHIYKLS